MTDILNTYRDTRIILRRSAMAVGFTDAEIERQLRCGALRRLCTGAYSLPVAETGHFEDRYEHYVRRVIAHAQQRPRAIVSHESAAALYGLPLSAELMQRVHLTKRGTGSSRRRPDFQLHATSLADQDICLINQHVDPLNTVVVRLTSPALTVIDTARSGPFEQCVALADAALHKKLTTPEQLVDAVRESARRPGMSRARRVLRAVDGRSESVGESILRLRFSEAGLPPFDAQVNVVSSQGTFLARCDGAYIKSGVLFEFDGHIKYSGLLRPGETATDVLLREKRREQTLLEAGFIVVRFVWKELSDLRALRERVENAVARGRSAVAAGIVTGRCSAHPPITVAQ